MVNSFLTWTVVGGVDAVIATIGISTVSVWLVKAELVETTSAAVAPYAIGIKVNRRTALVVVKLILIMVDGLRAKLQR